MRCDDVTRELSAPSGRLDPSALAAHLAACPACVEAARLARLWAATRPAPPPGAFPSVWAGVEHAAEHAALPSLPGARARTRPGRRVIRWMEIAVAAGLLVTALAWHPAAIPGPGPRPAAPVVLESKVNIEEGQIAVISVDRRDVVTFAPAQNPASDEVAPDFAALNEFEAMAAL